MTALDGELGRTSGGEPIRGRVRVDVVCASCNAVIGKVLENEGEWLVSYARPRTKWGARRDGGKRVKAPAIVVRKRLHGAERAPGRAWCDGEGAQREVPMGSVYEALAEARETGRVRRVAV